MAMQIALDPPLGGLFLCATRKITLHKTPPGIKVSRKSKNIFAKNLESVTFGSLGNAVQKFQSLRTSG